MCYNVSTSSLAYLLGLLASFLLFYHDHPVLASLVGVYSGVQLAEGVIWYSLDTHNRALNRYGTQLLTWNLASHAVITVSAAIYFGCVQTYRTGYRTGGYSKHETLALFVLWAIAITVMVMLVALKKPGARTKALCDDEGHKEGRDEGHEEEDGVVGAEAVTEEERWNGAESTSFLDEWSCRLWWNWSSLDGTVFSVGYIIQVVVVFAALYIVYRNQLQTWCKVLVFLAAMMAVGVLVTVVAQRQQQEQQEQQESQESHTPQKRSLQPTFTSWKQSMLIGVSTMWCFASAVGAPLLAGWLWVTDGSGA